MLKIISCVVLTARRCWPMSWQMCGQGQFTLWGMEPAEAHAAETERQQAVGGVTLQGSQIYLYLPRMGFSVERVGWDVS